MPSLRQIEYLVALSETLHFRRAAERVGVSQPTLSAQLSALEERLGVQLVERTRNSVLITPVGRQILASGRRILRDVQEIRDVAASQQGELTGSIRLGLAPTIGPYLLPQFLPDLHRKYPDLKFYVREQVPNALPAALADGTYDMVLMALPVTNSDLVSVPIFREPLFVIAPQDHPLAEQGHVERSDLAGQSVLALEQGHQLHEQVSAICEEFGARMRYDYEGTSLDTLYQMVSMGMGISFLPGLFVRSALARSRGAVALELKGRSLSRTIGLVRRSTSERQTDFDTLLTYIRRTVERSFKGFPIL